MRWICTARSRGSWWAKGGTLRHPLRRRMVLQDCAPSMKANITLKLDATLIREIQELAAAEGTSVSALLTARLEQIVRERKTYERAQKRALARLGERLDLE